MTKQYKLKKQDRALIANTKPGDNGYNPKTDKDYICHEVKNWAVKRKTDSGPRLFCSACTFCSPDSKFPGWSRASGIHYHLSQYHNNYLKRDYNTTKKSSSTKKNKKRPKRKRPTSAAELIVAESLLALRYNPHMLSVKTSTPSTPSNKKVDQPPTTKAAKKRVRTDPSRSKVKLFSPATAAMFHTENTSPNIGVSKQDNALVDLPTVSF